MMEATPTRELMQRIQIKEGTNLVPFTVEQLSDWLAANDGPHDSTWVNTDEWKLWQAVSGFRSVLTAETMGGVESSIESAIVKKSENGHYTVEQVRRQKTV
jgi:hypothetical protein